MPDMLVKLYELPELAPVIAAQRAQGVDIRRSMPPEQHIVLDWVCKHFSKGWESETSVCYTRFPVSCFVAVENERLIGFATYDATHKGFFGPTGVDEAQRGRGIGKALLLACMHAMYAEGYGYAIIGWVGPAEFYAKAVGATLIPDSEPGVYRGMLRG